VKIVLFIVFLFQSLLFAINEIPFIIEDETYANHKYNDIEFYTKGTSGSTNKFLGLIVEDFKIEKMENTKYKVSFSTHNYSNILGGLNVYSSKDKNFISFALIGAHQYPTSFNDAFLSFFQDMEHFYLAIKYESLNVDRNPYAKTFISFTLPSKNYLLKISLNSDEAISFNILKLLEKLIPEISEKMKNSGELNPQLFLESFKDNDGVNKLKDIFSNNDLTESEKDDAILDFLVILITELASDAVKIEITNQFIQIKKGLDKIITLAEVLLRIKNLSLYVQNDLSGNLGQTIYINLSGIKKDRGFWGTNSLDDLKLVADTTRIDYIDVPLTSTYYTAVKYLNNIGSIEDATLFNPEDKVNRAEIVKMVLESREELPQICQDNNYSDSEIYETVFTDVKSIDWFSKNIWCAYDSDIANGYSNKEFRPEDNVSLAESFKIVGNGLSNFKLEHNSIRNWWEPYKDSFFYVDELNKLMEKIVETKLNRGEVAQLIYGICTSSKDHLCK